jgi:hypothetical protein
MDKPVMWAADTPDVPQRGGAAVDPVLEVMAVMPTSA